MQKSLSLSSRSGWLLLAGLMALCILVLALGGRESQESTPQTTELETRLERVLSAIEGAGEVRVMISCQEGGSSSAFATASPTEVIGVLIVCQGAENVRVRLAMEQAAQRLLGIDGSRIEIAKMEGAVS